MRILGGKKSLLAAAGLAVGLTVVGAPLSHASTGNPLCSKWVGHSSLPTPTKPDKVPDYDVGYWKSTSTSPVGAAVAVCAGTPTETVGNSPSVGYGYGVVSVSDTGWYTYADGSPSTYGTNVVQASPFGCSGGLVNKVAVYTNAGSYLFGPTYECL